MPVIGPDFISLQVSNLESSAEFYQSYLGLVLSQVAPPHAVVFETKPIAFALRDLLPGIELGSGNQPGLGVALWLHAPDSQEIHDMLIAAGVKITSAPIDGPLGRTFTFADPDGYLITLHSKA
ncbi:MULTISPECIES: VOC family protein [unclassified Paenibacillus]|uniref:VOC family protein n=1 Tax=unclassified Paenibacillus TaxID=185978 RepID=UPI00240538C4|nr:MULTISPECIES: VOC family protein [unclassified Paenibacillus]MDF9844351.1 putative enzyme related to lactoylglutathione lyase [Paenibacillus sp. PastF-2]MDF9850955.1 putative enzyme related to lactoylglutathione lyase [Paenibacillus sp. PastM-2]MDF9857526.1 putative enzyme related to lactoylglutathione lyase [Paenibacillus sp. PastF-1]MDH6482833.1 putative enzyme related to lactoylglutathione lyase [Paenibacillus sp. PastH-2]MDH6510258.1 putative enzyme related to lactoylglutathione lyase [